MNTGAKELKSILEELDELKLPHMAAELETLYKQPAFVNTGRLELISTIIHAEYIVTITNRYTSRLKKTKLKAIRKMKHRKMLLRQTETGRKKLKQILRRKEPGKRGDRF